MSEVLPSDYPHYENAQVYQVRAGRMFHDGRAEMTVEFIYGGGSGGQNTSLSYANIDQLITVCGGSHLADCEHKYLRVARNGYGGTITALFHITDDKVKLILKNPEQKPGVETPEDVEATSSGE